MGFSSILKMELLVSQLKNIKMNKMVKPQESTASSPKLSQ